MQLDDEAREVAIEATLRQLEAAEQADLAAETDKRVAAAKRAQKDVRKALDEYAALAPKVVACLEAIAQAEQKVLAANELLPADAQLPSIEQSLRGLPSEPRQELGSRVIGERWYTDSGAPVSDRDVARIKSDDERTGTLELVDRDAGLTRHATVVKRRLVEVTHLEGRPAYTAYALHGVVSLPGIAPGSPDHWAPTDAELVLPKIAELKALLGKPASSDPRAPREKFTCTVIEDLP
jgi:hypothetical protein